MDRNCRYDSRGKEPEIANSVRKCTRQRLPRDEITVTNREAGNEGEIDCIPDRPALNKTSQQAQGKLNCYNCRQHRPRHVNGMAQRHKEAPPVRCRPVHVVATSANGALLKQKSSNRKEVRQVMSKKISRVAEGVAHQYVERSSRGKQNAEMSPLGLSRNIHGKRIRS